MKLIYFIICWLVSMNVIAQKNEYVIKNNGDTVYGNVELKNKKIILGRKDMPDIILNAKDVKTVHTKRYKDKLVLPCKLNTYVDNLESLERYSYITYEIDTVLLLSEVYNSPKMNLYFCTDANDQQYYFYKTPKDSLPVQLYVNYTMAGGRTGYDNFFARGQDALTHIEVQRGFVNQLKLAMEDCPNISNATWELLDYRIYSFKKLIKLYNNCK